MKTATRQWCPGRRTTSSNKRVRCLDCNKLLTPYAVFHMDKDEVLCFVTPPHKTKPKTYKRPSKSRKRKRA